MINWKNLFLKDLASFSNGKKRPDDSGCLPVYGGNGILGYSNLANYKDVVIVGRVGAYCGSVYYEPNECWVSDNAIATKNKTNVDVFYLFYLLKSLQLNKRHIGTSQPLLTQEILNSIEVKCPPFEYQKQIGGVLRTLDEKIENNSRINKNLLQQAHSIFEYSYDRAINLVGFTSKISVLGGGTPKTGESSYWNGSVPFFTPKDVGEPYTLKTEKYLTEKGLANCNSRLFTKDTVFVTARGTVGKIGLAGIPMAMNQSCYALIAKEIDPLLVYLYTRKTINNLKHKASGAVFDAITTKDFESEYIRELDVESEKNVVQKVHPMFDIILNNSKENQRLSQLRDALLPKLMSGEIDVSSVEL